jgi:hypothetical protein
MTFLCQSLETKPFWDKVIFPNTVQLKLLYLQNNQKDAGLFKSKTDRIVSKE